jgi:hypothetical protein
MLHAKSLREFQAIDKSFLYFLLILKDETSIYFSLLTLAKIKIKI